jgi:toxin FitB
MTFLVDANVLSEPTKPSPEQKVVDWLDANEGRMVVDPIVIGELLTGILALPAGRKRTQLQRWFGSLEQTVQCLPWDAAVGRRWAILVVELQKKGRVLPVLDSMMAATALEHDLTVATRNVRHFRNAGVRVLDPFE